MSFKKKVYKLVWEEGHAFHGLEIRIKGMTVNDLTTLGDLKELRDRNDVSSSELEPVLELFTNKIVSWNYVDDDDNPIPVSLEAVKDLEMSALVSAIAQWQEVVAGVSAPLKPASDYGEISLEASIPMETS